MYPARGDIRCCNIKYPFIFHLCLLYRRWVPGIDIPLPGVYFEYAKAFAQTKSGLGLLGEFLFPADVVVKDDQSSFDGIALVNGILMLNGASFLTAVANTFNKSNMRTQHRETVGGLALKDKKNSCQPIQGKP